MKGVNALQAPQMTPSMWLQQRMADALSGLGVSPYRANKMTHTAVDALRDYGPLGTVDDIAAQSRANRAAMAQGRVPDTFSGNALMAVLGGVPGGRAVGKALGKTGKGIVAYHGSPHTFDKFSLDKIGTGEGAQAYGHGLYFAENEAVAKAYRDTLAGNRYDTGYNNVDAMLNAGSTWAELKTKLAPNISAEIEAAGKHIPAGADGSMYQVRINADPQDFLDWDAPLGQQKAGAGLLDYAKRRALAVDAGDKVAYAVKQIEADAARTTGNRAKPFQEAGIPGIKYLDQGSRTAGDGSRNFVVFDDKLIQILKRYSWTPGMAVPAAAMAEYQAQGGATPTNTEGGI